MPPKQRCRRLLGALAMACACTLASQGARAASERGVIEREARVAAADGGPPVYVKEILGPVLTLDRIYPSMKGPFATHGFRFEGSDEGELLWLTGYDAVMVAADGSTPMSQQFMCNGIRFSSIGDAVQVHRPLGQDQCHSRRGGLDTMGLAVSNVDDAAKLKAVAIEYGLGVRDKISHSSAERFVIVLDNQTDGDRLYVHASPNKISITVDLTDASDGLTYEQALEKIRETINE